jgi:hypothetical protein
MRTGEKGYRYVSYNYALSSKNEGGCFEKTTRKIMWQQQQQEQQEQRMIE